MQAMLAALGRRLPSVPLLLRPFSSATDHLLCEDNGPVRTLTLNNPKKRNPLPLGVLNELSANLHSMPSEIGVVVIKANGKVFSAGHNLSDFSVHSGNSMKSFKKVLQACSDAMLQIAACPVPTIASVHGAAAAAGCQLVASCDLAVAAESASFALPGIHVGLFCHTPAVPVVRSISSQKKAAELLFTGDFISAAEALQHGLVGCVVPDAELEDATAKLVTRIVRHSRPAVRLGKKALLEQTERLQQLEKAYKIATAAILENLRLMDTQEGISAFLKKEKPTFSHSEEKVL